MKILNKLLLAFFFISILASLEGFFWKNAALSIGARYGEVGDSNLPLIKTLEEMRFSGMRIVTSTNEYYSIFSLNETSRLTDIERSNLIVEFEHYDMLFSKYEILVTKFFPEENELLERIRTSSEKLKTTSYELIYMKDTGVSKDRIIEKFVEFEDSKKIFLNIINEALKHEDEKLIEKDREILVLISDSARIISIMVFLTISLAIAVGWVVSRSISNPIQKLKIVAEDIKNGKLDKRIDVISNDETGILGEAFNKMMDQLSHEITENKITEDKLSQKNDFVNSVLESLSHPFYVINVNDHTIALANSAARKKDSADGSTCYALIHKSDKPCRTDGNICPLEEVTRTKKPVVVEHLHYDKDGNVRIMEVHSYPIFNGKGDVVQIIEYSLDITERKRGEGALAESESKFRTLFDNATDGIMLVDIETKKQYMVNKMMSRMLGYSLEEIKNLYVSDIHPEKDLPWITEVFGKQVRGEITLAENIPVKRKNGTVFLADINTSQMNIAGKAYNIGIFRDVTERKRNEQIRLENQRLELANRTKNEFLSVMSHELRTPLNAIIGFSDLLKKKGAGELNERQQRYVENVYSSGKHLLGIIDDVLDLIRVESGKIEISSEKMSVPDAINTSVDVIKEKAASYNIIIKKQINNDIEFIETDSKRFRQVLNNLLDNAVKFSKPNGGTVTITAEKDGAMAKFSVSDTGIGIKDEDMKLLFQSFEQLDTGSTRKYGGTGLGLIVSKKLVELMGGSISVVSRQGEGSTFTFYLPIHAKNKEAMT